MIYSPRGSAHGAKTGNTFGSVSCISLLVLLARSTCRRSWSLDADQADVKMAGRDDGVRLVIASSHASWVSFLGP
eukprot:15858153-Heterocapsa_arctica.AAC.2